MWLCYDRKKQHEEELLYCVLSKTVVTLPQTPMENNIWKMSLRCLPIYVLCTVVWRHSSDGIDLLPFKYCGLVQLWLVVASHASMFLNGSYGTVNTSRLSLNNEDEDDEDDEASFPPSYYIPYHTVVVVVVSQYFSSKKKKEGSRYTCR